MNKLGWQEIKEGKDSEKKNVIIVEKNIIPFIALEAAVLLPA